MSDPEDIRVQLARMEGKQDVTNERLETANRINDERHEAIKARLSSVDARLNTHSDRITGLESREVGRDGERRGLTMAGRVVWAAVGLVPGGAIVAVIMKAFGG